MISFRSIHENVRRYTGKKSKTLTLELMVDSVQKGEEGSLSPNLIIRHLSSSEKIQIVTNGQKCIISNKRGRSAKISPERNFLSFREGVKVEKKSAIIIALFLHGGGNQRSLSHF